MKKITFLIMISLFIFSGCGKYSNYYKRYETDRYSVSNSHFRDNQYKTIDGNIYKFPLLPNGIYITFDDSMSLTVDYQKRKENIDVYPIHDVNKIFKCEKDIIVVTETYIFDIKIENPNCVTIINNLNNEVKSIIDSGKIDFNFSPVYVQNAFSLQDKILNKKYKVNYSTPVINGIVELGLYEKDFYFGQTVYSYFILDLKTDEIKYFVDKSDFDSYCKDRIKHHVETIRAQYLYD